MKSGATRKVLLAVAAGVIVLNTGAFTAGTASASPYPPAEISRTLFINPFDDGTGPAWLPYAGPRKIYLTAGTYLWEEEADPTWTGYSGLFAYRYLYLRSAWYYWRCWMQVVPVNGPGLPPTGVASHCTLTPADGATPTAYLNVAPTDDQVHFDYDGAGDYRWYSDLEWLRNP